LILLHSSLSIYNKTEPALCSPKGTSLIPNIIHFIFGLREDFSGKPFSFIHYLAIKTAYACNRPDRINFFYKYEPHGLWWERSRKYLNLVKIEPPVEIFGNRLTCAAHQADVMRLDILMQYGGIYLDMDVLCLRSFQPLRSFDLVLGRQGREGLGNAVILSRPRTPFLKIWYESYRSFRSSGFQDYWAEHSVEIPDQLAEKHPSWLHIEGPPSFFWPMYQDPAPLWGQAVGLKDRLSDWRHYYRIRRRSYCVHLWEQLWWDPFLREMDFAYFRSNRNNFTRLFRRYANDLF
jgi:hypothetical protein